jgi:hypothetical protein
MFGQRLQPAALHPTRLVLVPAFVCLATVSAVCGELSNTLVTPLPKFPARSMVGVWTGGGYVHITENHTSAPVVDVFDKSGVTAQHVTFTVPGAERIDVHQYCFGRAPDGTLALCGTAYASDGAGTSYLAILPPGASAQTIVRTAPYYPATLTFAADGSIWTDGIEGLDGKEINPEHLIIRRFDRQGHQVGGALHRSSFPGTHPSSTLKSFLTASDDRVGWYSVAAGLYIEFSLDGSELGRYPIAVAEPVVHGALCSDNRFWVASGKTNASDKHGSLQVLSRQNGAWPSIDYPTSPLILGCEANSLAMLSRNAVNWVSVH